MANLITIGRLILLFLIVWVIYEGSPSTVGWCMPVMAFVFAADGIDGWVARKRGSSSSFGAVFDIAGDRIAENVLWIIFADLGVIPVWMPLLVITRGFLVDGVRSLSYAEGMTAFGEKNMMRSHLSRWLTAGRFMRALFGWAKAAGFVFLTGLVADRRDANGSTWVADLYDVDAYRWFGWSLVWLALVLTVVRGIPVLIDAWATFGPDREQPAAGTTSVET